MSARLPAARACARTLRTLLLGPLYALQLLSSAKSFRDNPLIGSRRLNERGLHRARLRLAHRLAQRRRARLAERIAPEDRRAFDRDGFLVKRSFLAPAHFDELLREIRAYRGPAREEYQGNALTRRMACDARLLGAVPALGRLLAEPDWRALTRYVGSFDAEPMVYVQSIFSHARPGAPDPQETLHSDTFHATLKCWLFLCDVAPGCLCFRYVPGSHRLTPARLAWEHERSLELCREGEFRSRRGSLRVTEQDLERLGLPPAVEIAVPANTLLLADTHGFHARGASAGPALRVEIWAYDRRNPFRPWVGLDPWQWHALRDRRIGAFWRLGDALERLQLKPQLWRPRERVGAFERAGEG